MKILEQRLKEKDPLFQVVLGPRFVKKLPTSTKLFITFDNFKEKIAINNNLMYIINNKQQQGVKFCKSLQDYSTYRPI